MAPQISVILPAYNAEQTLEKAVQSVLRQSFRSLEVIVVNDGSTDGTAALAESLANRDARVHVLHGPNAGISAARNRGLHAAAGTYVTFCDDDDVWLPGALAALYSEARTHGADLVRGDYRLMRQTRNGTYAALPHSAGARCVLEHTGRQYAAMLQNSGPQFVWNALYRRAALQGLRFEETCRFGLEDFIFNAEVYARIARAIYLPQQVYCHYEGFGSTSVCSDPLALKNRIDAVPRWMQAESRAAARWCDAAALPGLWEQRCAQAITFLMHQLHNGQADPGMRRYAWHVLHKALGQAPYHVGSVLRHSSTIGPKQTAALLLYRFRMPQVYELLPHKEDQL